LQWKVLSNPSLLSAVDNKAISCHLHVLLSPSKVESRHRGSREVNYSRYTSTDVMNVTVFISIWNIKSNWTSSSESHLWAMTETKHIIQIICIEIDDVFWFLIYLCLRFGSLDNCLPIVWISLRWPIHTINPVDKTKLSCYTPHLRSTTVSLETYPLHCSPRFGSQILIVYLTVKIIPNYTNSSLDKQMHISIS